MNNSLQTALDRYNQAKAEQTEKTAALKELAELLATHQQEFEQTAGQLSKLHETLKSSLLRAEIETAISEEKEVKKIHQQTAVLIANIKAKINQTQDEITDFKSLIKQLEESVLDEKFKLAKTDFLSKGKEPFLLIYHHAFMSGRRGSFVDIMRLVLDDLGGIELNPDTMAKIRRDLGLAPL